MEISTKAARSILTPQPQGFLASGPFPFTHALSPYTGCGFGMTTCGLYCYAQFLPNWRFGFGGTAWGTAVEVKENAAALLDAALGAMTAERRRDLRILMSSITDPYQPIERTYRVTRRCLEVFRQYDDPDLLLVQTRGLLAARDFDLLREIPYAWLSVTIESDDQAVLNRMRGGPSFARRFALVRDAVARGIHTQIAVSPCLRYTPAFADAIMASGAHRVVVDTPTDGDGTQGQRTARSQFPRYDAAWRDDTRARTLYETLRAAGVETGWSAEGFCGIAPRHQLTLI